MEQAAEETRVMDMIKSLIHPPKQKAAVMHLIRRLATAVKTPKEVIDKYVTAVETGVQSEVLPSPAWAETMSR